MKIKSLILILTLLLFLPKSFSQTLKVGKRMPNFELMDQYGEYFNSIDYLNNKAMIVFFYTKDESDTCTREIVSFNNQLEAIEKLGAVVVGINPASVVFHRRFVIKLGIKYPILFDRNSDVQKKFKVPNIKDTKNPQRYTFVIDKKGIIKKILHYDSNAEIHIIESIKVLEEFLN